MDYPAGQIRWTEGRNSKRWFADGSLAAIAYGSVSAATGKEWIEVHAGSHRVVIKDFRSAEADGKTLWRGRQDKGHRACATAFRQAVAGGAAMRTEAMLRTMRATIQAAALERPSEIRGGS